MTLEVIDRTFHGPQPTKREPMPFSLSAFQDWQQCQAKYNFRHRRRLRPKVGAPVLEVGIILHEYLEKYYEGLRVGQPAAEAHGIGLAKIDEHTKRLNIAATAAHYAGDTELADQLAAAPALVVDIAQRYHKVRGYGDAARYQILVVEKSINSLLVAGVQSNSKVDLITRDRENGIVHLWEHKSTGNMPSTAFRLRDLQTTLYAEMMALKHNVVVNEIMWNYLRTKPPQVPHQNKPKRVGEIGALSKAQNVDTTWEMYAARIVELGLDFEDYADVFERLQFAETQVFFPRYANSIVVDRQELLLDYALSGQAVKRARLLWDAGASRPIKSLSRGCDFCPFLKVCEADLMGGDSEEIIRIRFTEGADQEAQIL